MDERAEAVLGGFTDGEWTTIRQLMHRTGLSESRVRYGLMGLIVRGDVVWRAAGNMNQYRRRGDAPCPT